MREAILWLVLLVFAAGAIVQGIRFRRFATPSLVAVYRDVSKPRAYRHMPLAASALGGLMVAWLTLASPFFLGDILSLAMSPEAKFALRQVLPISLLCMFPAMVFLLVWPPRRLYPAWLASSNERHRIEAPPMHWFDWALVAIAGGNFCLGAIAL